MLRIGWLSLLRVTSVATAAAACGTLTVLGSVAIARTGELMDHMPCPWLLPDPVTWMVYADWLYEYYPKRKGRRAMAIRFAEGLRIRPSLILVHTRYDNGVVIGKSCVERDTDLGLIFSVRPAKLSWVTTSWAVTRWAKPSDPEEFLAAYASTPADFPAMGDRSSWLHNLCLQFYYKVSYDVRVHINEDRVSIGRRK